jgi:hypothetical protein
MRLAVPTWRSDEPFTSWLSDESFTSRRCFVVILRAAGAASTTQNPRPKDYEAREGGSPSPPSPADHAEGAEASSSRVEGLGTQVPVVLLAGVRFRTPEAPNRAPACAAGSHPQAAVDGKWLVTGSDWP